MKLPECLLVLLLLLTAQSLHAEPAKEDLGYDVYEGKTNKIDHIAQADPQFVWVIYEGGLSGRKIARTELPPQLQAAYPYDPKKAAAFIKQNSVEYQARLDAQKAGLRTLESNVQSQIATLGKQSDDNESQIENLTRQIKAARKSHEAAIAKKSKIQLIQDQDDLRQRREKLEATLKQVQAQIDALP